MSKRTSRRLFIRVVCTVTGETLRLLRRWWRCWSRGDWPEIQQDPTCRRSWSVVRTCSRIQSVEISPPTAWTL